MYDASAKTFSEISLNQILSVGPTIQQRLFSILIQFRQHQYFITADIWKMYPQIQLYDEHQDMQLKEPVNTILLSAKFELRKWASNEPLPFIISRKIQGTAVSITRLEIRRSRRLVSCGILMKMFSSIRYSCLSSH